MLGNDHEDDAPYTLGADDVRKKSKARKKSFA